MVGNGFQLPPKDMLLMVVSIGAVIKVVGETLFLYGLLCWGFGIIVFFT